MMSGAAPVIDADGFEITPDIVLHAYRQRCFPMADDRNGRLRWYRPSERAVITWDRWKVQRSLAKRIRQAPFDIAIDRDFPAVIAACAERDATWISHDIAALYTELHRMGHAHSIEARDPSGALVGGLYGLAIGGCFCGESMFHRADDAAKICLVTLVERLKARGFLLLDCQQQTPHMERFGSYLISDKKYAELLAGCEGARVFP
jgi:leucyl/phenylalanyl-tRNA---protein transferase